MEGAHTRTHFHNSNNQRIWKIVHGKIKESNGGYMNARLQRPAIYGTRSYKSACFSQESFFLIKKIYVRVDLVTLRLTTHLK